MIRVMTNGTVFREIGSHMVGIRCSVIVLGMTSKTISRSSFKPLSFVTRTAVQLSMRSNQSEPGYLSMVKFRALPSINSVAGLTGQWEISAGMIWRGGCLIVFEMTGHTIRAETYVDSRGSLWMAGITIDGGMCPKQGETVEVIPYRLDINLPTLHGMAIFTTRTKLSSMNIGMTVSTFCPDIVKYQTAMTTGTSHSFMQSTQGVSGVMVMIELQLAPNWPPADGRVATLTN